MAAADPAQLSIAEAAELIRARRLSPVELVESVLRRIDRYEPHLNAYITVCRDSARAEAKAAEAEIAAGRHRGPLHGMPIAVKDLISTAGIRTTQGSKIYTGYVPTQDATVIRKLREAGGILLGKTNLHEFASGSTTINPHYGPSRNPWALDRIPGGSSGGSGVALAAHLCLGALGSDTGGSIRAPAGYCGIVGLKPTYGLVSRFGAFPLAWTLDHIGPMTKTVADCALMLNAIAGYDPRDPASASNQASTDYSVGLEAGVRGIKIGIPTEVIAQQSRINAEVWAGCKAALKALENEGAKVSTVSIPTLSHVGGTHMSLMSSESYAVHEKHLRERAEDYGEDVRCRLQVGALISAAEYLKAQRLRGQLIVECRRALGEVDLLAMPSVPVPAPTIAEAPALTVRMARSDESAPIRLTPGFNQTGMPAISVPAGLTKAGLPIGLQLAGPVFADGLVLQVARAVERALNLDLRQPQGLLSL